jgi:hypothetical protein
MAKRASNSAQLDEFDRLAALAHRYQQIETMARFVDQESCFRQALIGYSKGSEIAWRSSLSTRLLEWVFAEPATRGQKVPAVMPGAAAR